MSPTRLAIMVLAVTACVERTPDAADAPAVDPRIETALAAGPRETVDGATVWDWPEGWPDKYGSPRIIREGTSSWVCVVDDPSWPGNDAMCLDEEWQAWYRAYMGNGTPPRPSRIGIGYGLEVDTYASNTDPQAEEATPTNQWHKPPAHVMILFPDSAQLEPFARTPDHAGPYVMWYGTPFAHLMVPIK